MRIIASAVATFALAGVAAAQSLPPPGATSCSGCHGTELSLEPFSAEEIVAALAAYRDGSREATVMDRIARGFTEEEGRAIAEWIAENHHED